MKSVASPRWKRDGTFLARISRLVARDSAAATSAEGEQCSTEVEKLCKGGGDKTGEEAGKEEEMDVWRRVRSLLAGSRGRKSGENGESVNRGPGWRKSVQVERLCTGSKVIVKSCRRGDRCQTEPLVIPDTPDTPCEVSEMRCQTSDLTVLLSDS